MCPDQDMPRVPLSGGGVSGTGSGVLCAARSANGFLPVQCRAFWGSRNQNLSVLKGGGYDWLDSRGTGTV
jgi:hypothetical protein